MAEESSIQLKLTSIDSLTDDQKASLEAFCCGDEQNSIEFYLKHDALDDHNNNVTKTFLAFKDTELIGYFSLAADRVSIGKTSKITIKLKNRQKSLKTKSVPAIQINHLAVDKRYQKQGFGKLLIDYIFFIVLNSLQPLIGACLVTVYSLKEVVGFYEKLDFYKIGTQPRDQVNTCMAFYIRDLYDNTE